MNVNPVSINNNVAPAKLKNNTVSYCKNANMACDSVSFTSKKNDMAEPKKKSSIAHKALVATTGAFVPGLGQALNGQWGKAAMFAIGAPIAVFGAMCVSVPLAMGVGVAASIGMFVDAYRNA